MAVEYRKPLPAPDADAKPFWDSARQHRLRVPKCGACDRFFLPASPYCRHCWSDRVTWTEVSGRGRLYSWVVVHQAYDASFEGDLPYNIAIVELDEGPRLLTAITGIPHASLRADQRVRIVYDDVTPEWTLVKFETE